MKIRMEKGQSYNPEDFSPVGVCDRHETLKENEFMLISAK